MVFNIEVKRMKTSVKQKLINQSCNFKQNKKSKNEYYARAPGQPLQLTVK